MITVAPEGAYWCVVAICTNKAIVLSGGLPRDEAERIASDINAVLANARPIRPVEICARRFEKEEN